jgi:hypothetical protein
MTATLGSAPTATKTGSLRGRPHAPTHRQHKRTSDRGSGSKVSLAAGAPPRQLPRPQPARILNPSRQGLRSVRLGCYLKPCFGGFCCLARKGRRRNESNALVATSARVRPDYSGVREHLLKQFLQQVDLRQHKVTRSLKMRGPAAIYRRRKRMKPRCRASHDDKAPGALLGFFEERG